MSLLHPRATAPYGLPGGTNLSKKLEELLEKADAVSDHTLSDPFYAPDVEDNEARPRVSRTTPGITRSPLSRGACASAANCDVDESRQSPSNSKASFCSGCVSRPVSAAGEFLSFELPVVRSPHQRAGNSAEDVMETLNFLQDADNAITEPLGKFVTAPFENSPWVYGPVDNSPLRLSDMQNVTPESIRRQRTEYVRLPRSHVVSRPKGVPLSNGDLDGVSEEHSLGSAPPVDSEHFGGLLRVEAGVVSGTERDESAFSASEGSYSGTAMGFGGQFGATELEQKPEGTLSEEGREGGTGEQDSLTYTQTDRLSSASPYTGRTLTTSRASQTATPQLSSIASCRWRTLNYGAGTLASARRKTDGPATQSGLSPQFGGALTDSWSSQFSYSIPVGVQRSLMSPGKSARHAQNSMQLGDLHGESVAMGSAPYSRWIPAASSPAEFENFLIRAEDASPAPRSARSFPHTLVPKTAAVGMVDDEGLVNRALCSRLKKDELVSTQAARWRLLCRPGGSGRLTKALTMPSVSPNASCSSSASVVIDRSPSVLCQKVDNGVESSGCTGCPPFSESPFTNTEASRLESGDQSHVASSSAQSSAEVTSSSLTRARTVTSSAVSSVTSSIITQKEYEVLMGRHYTDSSIERSAGFYCYSGKTALRAADDEDDAMSSTPYPVPATRKSDSGDICDLLGNAEGGCVSGGCFETLPKTSDSGGNPPSSTAAVCGTDRVERREQRHLSPVGSAVLSTETRQCSAFSDFSNVVHEAASTGERHFLDQRSVSNMSRVATTPCTSSSATTTMPDSGLFEPCSSAVSVRDPCDQNSEIPALTAVNNASGCLTVGTEPGSHLSASSCWSFSRQPPVEAGGTSNVSCNAPAVEMPQAVDTQSNKRWERVGVAEHSGGGSRFFSSPASPPISKEGPGTPERASAGPLEESRDEERKQGRFRDSDVGEEQETERESRKEGLGKKAGLADHWVELNKKLRQLGLAREGVPVLDPSISIAYDFENVETAPAAEIEAFEPGHTQDLLSFTAGRRSPKPHLNHLKLHYLRNRKPCYAMGKKSRRLHTNFLKYPGRMRSARKRFLALPAETVSDIHGVGMPQGGLEALLANIDMVKVIPLWNQTLDELAKYKRYCAAMHEYEGSHLRVFQSNDTLKSQNFRLQEKVKSLEKLLAEMRLSRNEQWENEIKRQQLDMERSRLLRDLKEKDQKLRVVVVQKRQAERTVTELREQIHRLVEKEDRIRARAKQALQTLGYGTASAPFRLPKSALDNKNGAELGSKSQRMRMPVTTTGIRTSLQRPTATMAEQAFLELVWTYEEKIENLQGQKDTLTKRLLKLRSERGGPEQHTSQASHQEISEEPTLLTTRRRLDRHLSDVSAVVEKSQETFKAEEQPAGAPPRWVLEELHGQLKAVIEEKTKNELRFQAEVERLRGELETLNSRAPHSCATSKLCESQKTHSQPLVSPHFSDTPRETNEKRANMERRLEEACRVLMVEPRGTGVSGEVQTSSERMDTKRLVQRDKLLHKAGLKARVHELHKEDALFDLVYHSCRELGLEEPRRLPTLLSRLCTIVFRGADLLFFLNTVATITGVKASSTQLLEIERVLQQWRSTILEMNRLMALRKSVLHFLVTFQNACAGGTLQQVQLLSQNFGLALLQAVQKLQLEHASSGVAAATDQQLSSIFSEASTVSSLAQVSAQCVSTQASNVFDKEEVNVKNLRMATTAVRGQQEVADSVSVTGEKSLARLQRPSYETPRTASPSMIHMNEVVQHFMDVFEIPDIAMCCTAIDRLRLKIREHIRFFRGVLAILSIPQDTAPAEVFKRLAVLKQIAAFTEATSEAQDKRIPTLHELVYLFQVFRALQVRLNLPELPPGNLNVFFLSTTACPDPTYNEKECGGKRKYGSPSRGARPQSSTLREEKPAKMISADSEICHVDNCGMPQESSSDRGLLASSSRSSGSTSSPSALSSLSTDGHDLSEAGGAPECKEALAKTALQEGRRLEDRHWRHWAKQCVSTVDLLARMVEQAQYHLFVKRKDATPQH